MRCNFLSPALLPGLVTVVAIGAVALGAARVPGVAAHGLSALTLAIGMGALLGNLGPTLGGGRNEPGLRFAQRALLRAGVALYGFNLDFAQIVQVGAHGIAIDLLMVASTLAIGLGVGMRLLKLDRDTALLTSAGSAICGATAVVATVPVLPDDGRQTERTAAAVATVLLFGTVAMLAYPWLYGLPGVGAREFGIYVGSTVHEVAQVVAIGNALGGEVAGNAVIVKMIRVMLLVPFLLGVGAALRGVGAGAGAGAGAGGRAPREAVPWFALAFIGCAGLHSLGWIAPVAVDALRLASLALLAAAMAALGLHTTVARLRRAGARVFALGLVLFAWLVAGGAVVNRLVGG